MNDNNNNKDKYKNILRTFINTVLIIGIVLALAFGAYLIYSNNKQNSEDDKKLSYTDLVKEIEAGNVEKIEMTVGSATLKVKLKDEELYIQSADVYILDDYDSKEVKDFLFEKLGINAKVYYIGE